MIHSNIFDNEADKAVTKENSVTFTEMMNHLRESGRVYINSLFGALVFNALIHSQLNFVTFFKYHIRFGALDNLNHKNKQNTPSKSPVRTHSATRSIAIDVQGL